MPRSSRKQAQVAKHITPPDPTALPLPGVTPEEAEASENEWEAEAWDDISGVHAERELDKEALAYEEWTGKRAEPQRGGLGSNDSRVQEVSSLYHSS